MRVIIDILGDGETVIENETKKTEQPKGVERPCITDHVDLQLEIALPSKRR